MNEQLESELSSGQDIETALAAILKSTMKECDKIIFNGDGYSDDWQKEAKKRGLLNLRSTMDTIPLLNSAKNVELFETYKVLSKRELDARLEILYDIYFKTINIEGETTENIAQTMIIPSAVRYINELAATVERGKSIGLKVDGAQTVIKKVNDGLNKLVKSLEILIAANLELGGDEIEEKAHHMHKNVIPAMNEVRNAADQLEKLIADDYWPLPTYRDMLFVK
jgi:glutamine synthetase